MLDISDNGDSKMSENATNIPSTPPINTKQRNNNINATYTDISRLHGLESPICFADLLNHHSNFPTNNINFKINQTFEQFKDLTIAIINDNNTDLSNKFENEKQIIINEKDKIIEERFLFYIY